jgi:glycosidase
MTTWIERAILYHLYPLGLLGALDQATPDGQPAHRLPELVDWLPHITALGCNTIYLGPVFHSVSHGYDTTDYRQVDPRLGDNADLIGFIARCQEAGIRVLFDGVFNHVGREFFAFRDLQQNGENSPYREWFVDVDFSQRSPLGDPFSYYAYEGSFDLVKLNLANPEVRSYLFETVRLWFTEFGANGIRFDAVDVLDPDFVRAICATCREVEPDCWLMGEVVFDSYEEWLAPGMLDSVTNYEAYKGLWSSLNDRNMFEIAWSLNRQFGDEGIYRDHLLFTFADNHDVNRIASQLQRPGDLSLLYALLYTIPGVPSIYYGSEWGITGRKDKANDSGMRAAIAFAEMEANPPQPWLPDYLSHLAAIRQESAALRIGDYRQLYVDSDQIAFRRLSDGDAAIVVVNAGSENVTLTFDVDLDNGVELVDRLNEEYGFTVDGRSLNIEMSPNSSRILVTDG